MPIETIIPWFICAWLALAGLTIFNIFKLNRKAVSIHGKPPTKEQCDLYIRGLSGWCESDQNKLGRLMSASRCLTAAISQGQLHIYPQGVFYAFGIKGDIIHSIPLNEVCYSKTSKGADIHYQRGDFPVTIHLIGKRPHRLQEHIKRITKQKNKRISELPNGALISHAETIGKPQPLKKQ